MKRLVNRVLFGIAAFVVAIGFYELPDTEAAIGQAFNIPAGAVWLGHALFGNQSTPPTVTNGTLLQGSTDTIGSITNTAGTSMVLTFGTPYTNTPPFALCFATTTAEMAKCVVTATTLTITQFNGGEVVKYFVAGNAGG